MKSKLLIVACLVIVLSMALILPLSIVNADYSDIVNDPNSIVNFNQQFNNTLDARSNYNSISFSKNNYTYSVSGSFSSYSLYLPFTTSGQTYVNLINGHKYYIDPKLNIISGNTPNLILSNGDTHYIQNIVNDIYTSSVNASAYFGYWHFPSNTYNFNVTPIIVDLTLMFGSNDNIPTLEQCQNLFVADSYNYNTGTAMSFGSVNAYQQALSDIMSSYKYNLSVSALGLNSFAYKYKNVTSNFAFNQQYNFWYFENTFGVPLFTTLTSGTKVTLTYNLFTPNGDVANNYHLSIWYLNNQSDLVQFYIDPQFVNYSHDVVQTATFVLPLNVDVLYFNIYYDTTQDVDTSANCFVVQFDISSESFDVNTAISNAFLSGQKTIMGSYQVGGDKYQEIWQAGYINGLNAETPYTFSNLMSAVVESPLQAVLSIFNFDFLGYNFRNVITLILTLCIILAIIRLFIGMGGSE